MHKALIRKNKEEKRVWQTRCQRVATSIKKEVGNILRVPNEARICQNKEPIVDTIYE